MALSPAASNIGKSINVLEIYRGQSMDLELSVVQEGIDEATGKESSEVPVDLTGATVYMQVKSFPGDQRPLISKSSENALEITLLPPLKNGTALIHIAPGDTKNLGTGSYYYDVWARLGSGKQYPVIPIAEFRIKDPVTVIS